VQIDGFRFDLAVTLGRDEANAFDAGAPAAAGDQTDPVLADLKMIAEPWDVGMGGWQTGNFRPGGRVERPLPRSRAQLLAERHRLRPARLCADRHRRIREPPRRIREHVQRRAGPARERQLRHGARRLHPARSRLLRRQAQLGNGEQNRDGADTNRSFNHGAEGPPTTPRSSPTRRKAMRNLMGTLLLSAGVPMITAGDEFGRTQRGNNNAYCHDSPLTWLNWEHAPWQEDLLAHASLLTRLRRENPALRPLRFARLGEHIPAHRSSTGTTRTARRCRSSGGPTPAPDAAVRRGIHAERGPNRILLVVHGTERRRRPLPVIDGVSRYVRSGRACLTSRHDEPVSPPGDVLALPGTSMHCSARSDAPVTSSDLGAR
jgi:glycogen operon protein